VGSGERETRTREEEIMKTSSAKDKGRRLQQWTCQQISDLLNIPWGKDELIASREASQSGTDVRLIREALERFPFSIECKNQENWNLPSWIKQAKANQIKGTDWLLVIKKNHTEPVVVLEAKTFFELMKS
jgi:hypothetical protein